MIILPSAYFGSTEYWTAIVKGGDEVVIDAYSGGGLLTAMLAKRVEKVYGIELEREAVACADTLKEKN